MSYKLRQISKEPDTETLDSGNELNLRYMTPVRTGTAGQYAQPGDSNDSGTRSNIVDECVYTPLSKGASYYFHGQIRREAMAQSFNIKLVKKDDSKAQYIKKINVAATTENFEYADVEFIFTAAADFDAIVFELNRTANSVTPVIIYQELSVIGNILNGDIAVKIGVQSKPGLLMCINGQEIRVGKSGIYETRSNVVKVTQFSIVTPALEAERILETVTSSVCIFSLKKFRSITPFTLDYLYEVEEV